MMEIRIRLAEHADVPFIKKLLSQIKGITNIEVSEDDTINSWGEIEKSEYFAKVIAQSRNNYKNRKTQELTDDVLNELFGRK